MPKTDKKRIVNFEEYKLLSERTEKFSERRQTTTQIYLTINTAIFGGIAFVARDSGFHGLMLTIGLLGLFGFGILICSIWLNILINMERVLKWQYERLCEMENGVPDSFQYFSKEKEALYKPDKENKKFSFSLLEARLPAILIGIYVTFGLILIISVWFGGL